MIDEKIVYSNPLGYITSKKAIILVKGKNIEIPFSSNTKVCFERKNNKIAALLFLFFSIAILFSIFQFNNLPIAWVIVYGILFVLTTLIAFGYYLGNYNLIFKEENFVVKAIKIELSQTGDGKTLYQEIKKLINQ